MSETVSARLERRYQFVKEPGDAGEFLRRIKTYLADLDAERSARRIVATLRREVKTAERRSNEIEMQLMVEAVGIRRGLAEAAPHADNSDLAEPNFLEPGYMRWYRDSFASFDRLAEQEVSFVFRTLPYRDTVDATALTKLLAILDGRLDAAQRDQPGRPYGQQGRPSLDVFHREISNLREKHASAFRRFREDERTLPGLAHERLCRVASALTPEPFVIETDGRELDINEVLDSLGDSRVEEAIFRKAVDGITLDAQERDLCDAAIAFIRAELDRLHEEVVHRLALGEGETPVRRALSFAGRGSVKLGGLVVTVAASTIIGLLVTAYAQNWLPGQDRGPDDRGRPAITSGD